MNGLTVIDPTIVSELRKSDLLREGHFVFRSGRHSAGLLDRDLLLADPGFASHLGYAIAKRFFSEHVETVASPSIWGAGLAQWVGYFLEPKAKVAYATTTDGAMTIAPVLEGLVRGKRVLLIDNMVLTGETMSKFANTIDDLGAVVVGIATLWNTFGEEVSGHAINSLLSSIYEVYSPDECPICLGGGPAPVGVSF